MADLVAEIRGRLDELERHINGCASCSTCEAHQLKRALHEVVDQCELKGQHGYQTVTVDWLLENIATHLLIDATPVWAVTGVPEHDREALATVARFVLSEQCGAASTIQRRLRLGFGTVTRFLGLFEAWGLVGPAYGSMARKVLVSATEADNVAAAIRSGGGDV